MGMGKLALLWAIFEILEELDLKSLRREWERIQRMYGKEE